MTVRPLYSQSDEYTYAPVRLWRDDLERIVALIEEVYPEAPPRIQTDLYRLDSIQDLADLPSTRVRSVSIDIPKRFTVKILPAACTIEVVEPDTLSRGLVATLGEILNQSRRFPIRLVLFGLEGLAIALFLVSVLVSTGGFSPTNFASLVGGLALMAMWLVLVMPRSFGLLFSSLEDIRFGASQIFTKTRAEAPTFLMRKRDDLLIEAVVAVVSLLAGGFLGYWINTIT